ncbi:glycosyltransferase [Acidiphilium sp.]|uniref:glycosyltransferase n=1 Tax=Acidiphilium sp. TaxID=527 RepID=UPI003D041BED
MTIAALAALIWLYLYALHGDFWRSTPELAAIPTTGPDIDTGLGLDTGLDTTIDIIVPARDEAGTIGAVITSLLAQTGIAGSRVILVDDGSTDGTAEAARAAAGGDPRFTLITAGPKPVGWSGKLWALEQGIAHSTAPLLLLTDADITHDPRHLATLRARIDRPERGARLDLVSEMVRLNCVSPAERALIPAFVYFFQLLYPFARVNDPLSATAAAAGGVVLIRRTALERIGGIASIRGALIDDVTLARRVKQGGAIYLGHTSLARSIRPYPRLGDITAMIARTAFTQLRHSYVLLALTIAGMALIWLVPPAAILIGTPGARLFGLIAYAVAVLTYQPTLQRYRLGWAWGLALPLIALIYLQATLASAWRYAHGAGAAWKNRDYGTTA